MFLYFCIFASSSFSRCEAGVHPFAKANDQGKKKKKSKQGHWMEVRVEVASHLLECWSFHWHPLRF
jgi:hypothetical protein